MQPIHQSILLIIFSPFLIVCSLKGERGLKKETELRYFVSFSQIDQAIILFCGAISPITQNWVDGVYYVL